MAGIWGSGVKREKGFEPILKLWRIGKTAAMGKVVHDQRAIRNEDARGFGKEGIEVGIVQRASRGDEMNGMLAERESFGGGGDEVGQW